MVGIDDVLITEYFIYIVGGGIGITLLISFCSIFLAIGFVTLGALGRLSSEPGAERHRDVLRVAWSATPLLLQILFIYLALPQLGIVLPEIRAASSPSGSTTAHT